MLRNPRPGQVVVTEGNHRSFVSHGIARFTDSWLTHAFIVTGDDELVEASFPRVRRYSLSKRMSELQKEKRGYIILEYPDQTDHRIVSTAKKFIGRWYDIGQILLFVLTGKFIKDGAGTLVCSRLVTAAFAADGVQLFPEYNIPLYHRRRNGLMMGWATPDDIVSYSCLKKVYEYWPKA